MGVSQSSSSIFDYIVIKYNQVVGIQPISNKIPNSFKLEQNYPNPFNSSTNFKFQIAKFSDVKVTLYDILGREMGNPVNDMLKPGVYEINVDGTNYPSGVYFYQLLADGNIIDTKKFIVLK